jgi:hypothetical protein
MKKKSQIDVEISHIRALGRSGFTGGVSQPTIPSDQLAFVIQAEHEGDDGELVFTWPQAKMQINLYGTSSGYRELGNYLLALAELRTGEDPDYHQHFDDLAAVYGGTTIDVIVRRSPDGSPTVATPWSDRRSK